jgi:outer membrane protein OmpA-like peptidoglycan-associated protein
MEVAMRGLHLFLFIVALATLSAVDAGAATNCPSQTPNVPGPYYVFFDIGSTKINAAGMKEIKEAAQRAKAMYITRVCMLGKADKQGDEKMNAALSVKRAQAVADAMVKEGVKPEYIIVVGKGEPYGDWLKIFEDNVNDRSVKITLAK